MSKDVLKLAAVTAGIVGFIVGAIFARDEMDSKSDESIEKWAKEKVKANRTDDICKLFKENKEAQTEYDRVLKSAEQEVDGRLDKWMKENDIDKKLYDLEQIRVNDLKAYRDSIKYDDTIKRAKEESDFIINSWKSAVDYEGKKRYFKRDRDRARKDYENSKSALDLVSSPSIKSASEKLLKEDYENRLSYISEREKELDNEFNEILSKAKKRSDDISEPMLKQYKEHKKAINEKYAQDVAPIKSDISHKREVIEQDQYLNWTSEERHTAERATVLGRKVKEVEDLEDKFVKDYISDAKKHQDEIAVKGLMERGWSKSSIYFFKGIVPVGTGVSIIVIGTKFIIYGFRNIVAIRNVK